MTVVAVTGASGFVGTYLCQGLREAGLRVRELGRGVPVTETGRQTDYSTDSLMECLKGVSAIVHLAGRRMTRGDHPDDMTPFWEPNVAVIRNLIEAARHSGVKRLVLASTIAVYSSSSGLPYRETAQPAPINAYGLSKLMAEQYLELLTRQGDVSGVSLRLAAIYGAGEKGTPALMKFVNQARGNETLVLKGNPNYVIDQLYVKDAVSAFLAALTSETRGAVNIGGGRGWTVEEIARSVNAVFENTANLRLETDATAPLPETVMALDHAAECLNWHPTYDLMAGLEDFKILQNKPLFSLL